MPDIIGLIIGLFSGGNGLVAILAAIIAALGWGFSQRLAGVCRAVTN
ncbi:MAG: hypothetical protein M9945_12345 [Aquamicrobium sp.]|nr:hypothetical protein [Aquamicrobium sp.]